MQLRPDGLRGHLGCRGRTARARQVSESRRAIALEAAQPLPDGLRAAAQASSDLGDRDALRGPDDHPGAHRDAPDGVESQVHIKA